MQEFIINERERADSINILSSVITNNIESEKILRVRQFLSQLQPIQNEGSKEENNKDSEGEN